MDTDRGKRVKELVDAAQELPERDRSSFLLGVCRGDDALRREVESRLLSEAAPSSFMGTPSSEVLAKALAAEKTGERTDPVSALANGTREPAPTFAPEETIAGRFRVIRLIGCGGMGEVYEARDLELGERLALKTIRTELCSDERGLARFKKEVQLARRVTHPNVCRIFDLQRHQSPSKEPDRPALDVVFLTMELLEGETLAERLERVGRMTTDEVLPIVDQVARALAAAHAAGVVHRDFKPSNVMLVRSGSVASGEGQSIGPEAERTVVTDFGLARAVRLNERAPDSELLTSVTESGQVVGTFAYMAPEQLRGGGATPASDVYALGLVMYEMLAGQRPVSPPAPIAGLDPNWQAAIGRCLELEPKKRFTNPTEVVLALQARAVPPDLSSPHSDSASTVAVNASEVTGKSLPSREPIIRLGPKRLVAAAIALMISLALFVPYFRRALFNIPWLARVQNELRPSIGLGEGDSILVADFQNLSGEKLFDRTVSDLVARSLEESHFVRVVAREIAMEAVRRTGRANVDQIDASLGREISIRENYRALMVGQIVKDQAGYRIDVQLMDPRKDTVVLTESQHFTSSADLYDAVDKMVGRVRRRIGESLAQIEKGKPLAQVTTPSLAALTAYSRAMDLYGARDYYGSLAMAKETVALDPDFSMAHLLLANIYNQRGEDEEVHRESARARQNLARVTQRERHLVEAFDRSLRYDEEGAAEEYRVIVEENPNDIEALRGWADALSWTRQLPKAAEVQQQVVRLNPHEVLDYGTLLYMLVRMNNFHEALAVYQEAKSNHLDSPQLHWEVGLSYLGLDDFGGARREFERLRATPDEFYQHLGQLCLAEVSLYQGRITEVQSSLGSEPLPDEAKLRRLVLVRLDMLARSYWLQGQSSPAQEYTRRLVETLRPNGSPLDYEKAGLLAVDVGDLDLARRCLASLASMLQKQNAEIIAGPYYSLKGAIEASQHLDAALEDYRRAADMPPECEAYAGLGEAYAERGDWSAAIQADEEYLSDKGALLREMDPSRWLLVHLSLARADAKSGHSAEAKRAYAEFLALWAGADADLPLLRSAKTEYQELVRKVGAD